MKKVSVIHYIMPLALLLVSGCVSKPGGGLDSGSPGALSRSFLGDFSPEAGGGSATPGSQADFEAQISNKVYFKTDSAELDEAARATLIGQSSWMKAHPQTMFSLEGHSDERGTREYNISLSARRANAVRTFLQNQGIDKSRLSIIAFGKERPIEICPEARCWNKNRRAETVIRSL